ncbi:MAG: hypothetical protein AAF566_05570 [Pseudomonadota bacterium]
MRLLAVLALLPLPAQALELELTGFYDLNNPASLDYDPDFCGLWIANEGPELVLVTLEGDELRRFGSGLSRIKAVALEDQHLLVADGFGNLQRLTKAGEPMAAPFPAGPGFMDNEGLAIDGDGTLISVEDDPAYITWMTPDGDILRRIDGTDIEPPMTEPQGIARDPRTGHLLIVDDWEGTNSLYEFDAQGTLLATLPLIAYGRDPEGIAIRPGANQVFMAFDSGRRIASFDYTPTLPPGSDPVAPGGDCVMF